MFKVLAKQDFTNGSVWALETEDGFPIEVTDTFLPIYTKYSSDADNTLYNENVGSRKERWMIGVSVMSGCPIHCKFCATGKLKKWRNLTASEIVEQVLFVIDKNSGIYPGESFEFKINYTRMGEPFLNINAVRKAVETINTAYPNTHHYISTIGIKNSDFSFVENNITLQVSLHSLDERARNKLIPYKRKMAIKELGNIRTKSNLKTTVNMTLVNFSDFNIEKLKENFNPEYFFIKLSPINPNEISNNNNLGIGIVEQANLV